MNLGKKALEDFRFPLYLASRTQTVVKINGPDELNWYCKQVGYGYHSIYKLVRGIYKRLKDGIVVANTYQINNWQVVEIIYGFIEIQPRKVLWSNKRRNAPPESNQKSTM